MSGHRSAAEELANCLTHGLGLVLSIVGLPLLVVLASERGDAWKITSCSVYGSTLVALYGASTLYHGIRAQALKKLLRTIDHTCIYILIAGTYTPFTLVNLRGGWGWTLFGLVWGFALAGISFKIFLTGRYEILSTVTYVLIGWTAIIAVKPMIERIPAGGLLWLLAGGLAYTFGVLFYAWERRRYTHTIWHLFVLAGSICHYVAVARYVLPA